MGKDLEIIAESVGGPQFNLWKNEASRIYDEQSSLNKRFSGQGERALPQKIPRSKFISEYIAIKYAAHLAASNAAMRSSTQAYLGGVNSS